MSRQTPNPAPHAFVGVQGGPECATCDAPADAPIHSWLLRREGETGFAASNPFDGAPLVPVQLTVVEGRLYLGDEPLMYFYPSGDVDCLPWPLVSEYRTAQKLREHLCIALADEIETGHLPDDTQAVLLPDGTRFALDGAP